jgi:hypothetical protein
VGSDCHRRRVVSAGRSPRLSAFHQKRDATLGVRSATGGALAVVGHALSSLAGGSRRLGQVPSRRVGPAAGSSLRAGPANVRLQQLRRQLLEPPALERREGDVLAEPISHAA